MLLGIWNARSTDELVPIPVGFGSFGLGGVTVVRGGNFATLEATEIRPATLEALVEGKHFDRERKRLSKVGGGSLRQGRVLKQTFDSKSS